MRQNIDYKLYGNVHCDLSAKYFKKQKTGIAVINSDKSFHRGICLTSAFKKSLKSHKCYTDERLHSICIWKIIEQDIDSIECIILCMDTEYEKTKRYLEYLFQNKCPKIESLSRYREELQKNVKSLAHNIANAYRKRAFKLSSKGKELNVVKISYKEIIELLVELEEFDKKSE